MYVNTLDDETIWVEEGDLENFYQEIEQENEVFTYIIIGQSNLKKKPK